MGTMTEEIPPELTTEVGSLLKIITNSVRCSSCLNIIREPQKGSCAHNACAKCWGSSGRKCKVCKANTGVQLVPNNDLNFRVAAVMKLVKSFQEWSKIDVLSNDSSNDTEISNQKDIALNECFYEKDVKYMNMKTYKGKPKPKISKKKGNFNEEELIEDIYSDSNQLVIKKSNIDAKVDSWLSSPVNKFSHIPKNNMPKKINKQSIEGDKDTKKVHNLREKNDKEDANSKTHNKSNESVPSKSESKTKVEWIDVKKCKKTLQKGKKEKKKLSVSVESCSKNISNTDVNNQPNSFHTIEDVSTPKCDIHEDIVIESNNIETNINKNQIVPESDSSEKFIEINNIENNVIENFDKIESAPELEKPHTSENIEAPCDINFSQKNQVVDDCLYSERIKKVPFFYSGKLSTKTAEHFKKKVPFNFEVSSKSNKWLRTTDDSLNIKIHRENSITSITIQEGYIQHVANITKTTGTQTSPDCFKNKDNQVVLGHTENELNPINIKTKNIHGVITSESAKSNNICNEMENDIQIQSDNDFVVNKSVGNDTFSRNKRSRIDTSNNDLDYSNPTKKNRLSISDMPIDENMVICFDSQSQIFNSEELNKSEMEKKSSGKLMGHENLENSDITRHKSKVDISIPNNSANDDKLLALKKSIEIYVGNNNSGSNKKSFLTSVSNDQIDINTDALEDIGISQIPIDCEKQIDEESHTPYSVIEADAIVEDTPQKSRTRRITKRNSTRNSLKENVNTLNSSISKNLRSHDVSKPTSNISKEKNDSDMDETLICESINKLNENKLSVKKKIITPSSINKFKHDVKHQSTPLQPLAKRSLTYDSIGKCPTIGEEEEVPEKHSLSRSHSCHAQSLLEKEFIDEALENTVGKKIEGKKNDSGKDISNIEKKTPVSAKRKFKKMCLVCSLLNISEKNFIETISKEMGWDYSSTFTRDLSHLIVKVDADNRTQRTEKYIRALAYGCWIVSFEWIEQCIKAKRHVPEDAFEVLDSGGDRGPYLMRTSKTKLFQDVTFYLLPPFELLPIGILEEIILTTGGKVVKTMKEAFVTDSNKISIVLVEVKDTQEDRFIDMCLQHPLVPVNVEWVLESLGRGNRNSLGNWILSHQAVLPQIDWPGDLFSDDELNTSS